MTWWDHSSGSIWSQPLGEAIAGPRKGQTVDLVSSQLTTWGAWRGEHQDSLALDVPSGPTGFDLADLYIVVDFNAEASAYPVEQLRQTGVVNDELAGLEIAVVIDPRDDERWEVFSRRVDDEIVELEIDGDSLRDTVSGTTFDPANGLGIEGPLSEQQLDLLPALTSFPGDYDTFWPDGEVWQP